MELVDYSQAVFAAIAEQYRALAKALGSAQRAGLPLPALRGENLAERSATVPW